MAKVTSKLQVTLPKALAEEFGIRPGDEIVWQAAGDAIRIVPAQAKKTLPNTQARLRLFDQATARQLGRQGQEMPSAAPRPPGERGWTREVLYDRGRFD